MAPEALPYENQRKAQAFFATKPTAWTRFLRTFIPWQIARFIIINLKMIRIIGMARH